ncbi:hypothetical protein Pmani_029549 [Petrolisthes manimaculis]|uniref:Uncharacterized protein n=1 Tax=Petrolisthes manimaculis TaxID=1843537 RepID=A0AAE1NZW9_9EUCA|nr:hypothetical protein Pmani_029549 [Petrolisthes manimaculis]
MLHPASQSSPCYNLPTPGLSIHTLPFNLHPASQSTPCLHPYLSLVVPCLSPLPLIYCLKLSLTPASHILPYPASQSSPCYTLPLNPHPAYTLPFNLHPVSQSTPCLHPYLSLVVPCLSPLPLIYCLKLSLTLPLTALPCLSILTLLHPAYTLPFNLHPASQSSPYLTLHTPCLSILTATPCLSIHTLLHPASPCSAFLSTSASPWQDIHSNNNNNNNSRLKTI